MNQPLETIAANNDAGGDYLLLARNIGKTYGSVTALKHGALKLRAGSVHALCGGNGAGKTTFLSILMGMTKPDHGEILLDGVAVDFHNPRDALAAGIAIITQELSPLLEATVAENIFLGREPTRSGIVDYARMFREAQALLDRLKFAIDARAVVGSLSLSKMQLVEIAKAISQESRILIMDEPTSAIGEAETDILFDAIRSLTQQGVGIIYVSHRLSELFRIAEEYTVFRDGEFVEAGKLADIDREELVRLIVGKTVRREKGDHREPGSPIIEVENYGREGVFENISLQLREREIVGLFGLMGAGRSEFLDALFGVTKHETGSLKIEGQSVTIHSPSDAIAKRLAFATEDRKDTGLILCRPIRENISLSSLKENSIGGFVRRGREKRIVAKMASAFSLKMGSAEDDVETLSGGNQQKVVLSRCLVTDPRILLCDEPTRGIDEGSKQAIYTFLRNFVSEGRTALVVSSELDEILQVADRIIVFRRGRIAGELAGTDASHEALLHLAS
ncbi:sugar ABC transporter ATP-binding protein [Agrobacterium rhizogenes]|uniref:Ribose ABC transport system, ATP-binding protein n=1 Tax=Rhizobium rhizogenes (strain K84 / ATCC BAA-868) TaxID=311403 RepID=B9JQE4_RHIR8|nr:sugar ABC transporter ATP-binding protein [Rhizobium rhizogenes]ACM31363.1 ribose ABC transport system, ATP-binding protein [Rhizobium rhizogenes K84]OCJ17368.1 D-xylose ABC transporter ATP-binding protein [Agrobacterium sp. B131/95]OCJ28500.1 D-xylose ABC transporter ATP-binding protein [Agrobacterium sp. B133/95]NTI46309.1 sugar ABC transporter ATP-binding protein [Rhizobium rhizogenes]NTI52993.1 sugar ABC transporter ATP-binding protein [Rhizobium rhizogenes]